MLPVTATAQKSARSAVSRPLILGISHIAVYATDPIKTADFYERIVGCEKMADFEDHPGVRYAINTNQYVEVMPLPATAGDRPARSHRFSHDQRGSDAAVLAGAWMFRRQTRSA